MAWELSGRSIGKEAKVRLGVSVDAKGYICFLSNFDHHNMITEYAERYVDITKRRIALKFFDKPTEESVNVRKRSQRTKDYCLPAMPSLKQIKFDSPPLEVTRVYKEDGMLVFEFKKKPKSRKKENTGVMGVDQG